MNRGEKRTAIYCPCCDTVIGEKVGDTGLVEWDFPGEEDLQVPWMAKGPLMKCPHCTKELHIRGDSKGGYYLVPAGYVTP